MPTDPGSRDRGFPKTPEPFGLTAYRGSYTPREATENALAQLLDCVRAPRPVMILSGPPGLGKTLLLHVLAHRLDEEVHAVFLPYGALKPEDFCAIALDQLGSPSIDDPVGMLKAYARHLQEDGSALLLLIDDAGAMPAASLRWCAELARSMDGAMRCVFAVTDDAHSGEVIATLGSEAAEVRLAEPMSRKETNDYVEVQLAIGRASGAVRALFGESTVERLYAVSGGVPRRLHIAAHAVLRQEPATKTPDATRVEELEIDDAAPDHGATTVIAPAIREEIERLRRDARQDPSGEAAESPETPAPAISRRRALMVAAFAAAVVAGMGIAFAVRPLATWVFRDSPPAAGRAPEAAATARAPGVAPAPEAPAQSPGVAAVADAPVEIPVVTPVPEAPAQAPGVAAVAEAPVQSRVVTPAPETPAQSPPLALAPETQAPVAEPETAVAALQVETPPPVTPPTPSTAAPVAPSAPEPPRPSPFPTVAVNINATPWASIEVDGAALGETPLAGVPLTVGLHRFRARLPDGRVIEREIEIDAEKRFVVFEPPPAEAAAAP